MAERRDVIDLALFHDAQRYLRNITQNRIYGAGGVVAWERFYTICDGLIHRFATAFGARASDLDDSSQETWAELVPLLIEFEYDPQRGEFRTWLYKIVRSATVNFLRRRNQQQAIRRKLTEMDSDQVEKPAHAAGGQDVSMERLLHHAQSCLSPVNYKLMCLRWLDGRPVAAVAQELRMTQEQVWYHEHRIRKTLRRTLTSLGEGAVEERRAAKREADAHAPARSGAPSHARCAA